MAASTDSTLAISASIAGIMNEIHNPQHLQVIKTLTSALREEEYRDAVEEEVFSDLLKVLTNLCEELHTASADGDGLQAFSLQLQLTAECFRAQRNACVQSTRNQSLLETVFLLLFFYFTNAFSLSPCGSALRCGIQFLGNLAVGNQTCKDDIWQLSFPDLLLVDDEKVVNYTSMVLHTCLDETKVEDLSARRTSSWLLRVMELCRTRPELDWTCSFYISAYNVFNLVVTLLELLFAQLREEVSEECGVPPDVARFLAGSFQKSCGAVLALATGSVLQEALTVISLLDVLCEMTSDLKQFMFLQDHPDLLVTTVELLQQVHAIGKASKNIFSAAQNFSSLSADGESPVISFKAHLIRFIGNLCHGNAGNQNKVRELEGIPLILDNCNIDSNNPFISQWAIFAIRNLLENNVQNQELVASLERRGKADYSALRQLGFLVEERDGSLLLKTVRKDS
uniref:Ataxin-10 n=1 Tax=Salarias fasciatus TaxID=181472 RepID=A0A672H4S9_SALFA